jgi:SAM-dependent methyltransferase
VTTAILLFAFIAGDTAWRDFADWFSRNGIPGATPAVMTAYAAALKTQGVADAEAQSRIKEVQAYMAAHPGESLVLHFDRIYTWPNAPFSREPSALLKKIASTRKPGRALDIAMGQGRNSIWLAQAGWKVSGYDISGEALRQANAAAAAAGLQLDTRRASHDDYPLGQAQWDLVLMSYAFTNLHDPSYMQRVRDSIKPGGILIVEGFGGPRKETEVLLKSFENYHVLLLEDLPDIADWGKMKVPLLRLAVEKP